jgi:hypothetical protein
MTEHLDTPAGATSIGNGALSNYHNPASVYLSPSMFDTGSAMGSYAFDRRPSLMAIYVDSLPTLSSWPAGWDGGCQLALASAHPAFGGTSVGQRDGILENREAESGKIR